MFCGENNDGDNDNSGDNHDGDDDDKMMDADNVTLLYTFSLSLLLFIVKTVFVSLHLLRTLNIGCCVLCRELFLSPCCFMF